MYCLHTARHNHRNLPWVFAKLLKSLYFARTTTVASGSSVIVTVVNTCRHRRHYNVVAVVICLPTVIIVAPHHRRYHRCNFSTTTQSRYIFTYILIISHLLTNNVRLMVRGYQLTTAISNVQIKKYFA